MPDDGKLHGRRAPLEVLHQARLAAVSAELDASRLVGLVGLPVAHIRSLLTSYDELHADPDAIRLCRGTSCMLAGAGQLEAALVGHKLRHVYCLGYCDRSPALLSPEGQAKLHCRPAAVRPPDLWDARDSKAAPPQPSQVRCTAREAIATGRLLRGGCDDLAAARAAGVYESLESVLRDSPEAILNAVEQSGVRGRGGAGFPTGRKWQTCARAPGDRKYVIANGDEGDPGSFIDRELMERDPHSILEGLILAGYATGAHQGIVFIRSEYPSARRVIEQAIEQACAAGLLGRDVAGHRFSFDVRVVSGMGSYVCGEETALLNAIEGKRGEARPRPPYPAEMGLYGRPTVVDNVETLVNIAWIARHGAAAFRRMGTSGCPGTKALCLNHAFARPGIVEVEFGVSLRRVIEEFGGGAAAGSELESVLMGGPMGSFVDPEAWDVPVCIDALRPCGVRLGHGGLVGIPRGTDHALLLRHMLEFMAHESCGKCVPCRIGTQRAMELTAQGGLPSPKTRVLEQIFDLMEQTSLCGFGRNTPAPVRQLMKRIARGAEGRGS